MNKLILGFIGKAKDFKKENYVIYGTARKEKNENGKE